MTAAGRKEEKKDSSLRKAAGMCFVKDTRTCRICSRSSANASATDAIQNCLNRFRRACSSWARLLDPSGGKNGGAFVGGGEGEGDRGRSRALGVGSESVRCVMAGCVTGASSSSSPPSESDDEDEDEDKDGDGDGLVACGFIRGASLTGVFFWSSDSSDEESEEFEGDEDEAWRRLRFLLRLRGAVGLAAGI
jgi:hypothetical protein